MEAAEAEVEAKKKEEEEVNTMEEVAIEAMIEVEEVEVVHLVAVDSHHKQRFLKLHQEVRSNYFQITLR